VTDDGSEIGIGQALQAWASDIRPDGTMNPILIKPINGKLRTIANGAKNGDKMDRAAKFAHVLKVYDELCDMFEAVVAEGSGSAAEINLRENDVANVNFAISRNIPMVLVGDINKGGVFAGLYGTWRLIEDKGKDLLKGFIINNYHGDKEILKSGIERVEELTGMKCLGIVPHMNVLLPEEDAGEGPQGYSDAEIDRYVGALDKMLDEVSKHVDMEKIFQIMSE
jgi:adenosylcobyric acid synthase